MVRILVLSIFSVAITLLLPAFAQESVTGQPVPKEKIYSVKEALRLLHDQKNELQGKTIAIRAYNVDAVKHFAECVFTATLMDYEDARLYDQVYTSGLSATQREDLRRKIEHITMKAVPNKQLGGRIHTYAVYQGHFFDKELMAHCGADKWDTFFVEKKLQEIITHKPSYRTETIAVGLVIANGVCLKPPYKVVLKDYKLTINGQPYGVLGGSDEPSEATEERLIPAWEMIVSHLKRGMLLMYRGGCSTDSPELLALRPASPTILSSIDAVLKSKSRKAEKAKSLAKLLNLPDVWGGILQESL